jgi:hypothetical protein
MRRVPGIHVGGVAPSCPQITFTTPRTGVPGKVERVRDGLAPGDAFYYPDEFNLSWLPTLRAMWSPNGQQVMIPTSGQPAPMRRPASLQYRSGPVRGVPIASALLQVHRLGAAHWWANS